jgi:hypothetical protein
MTIKKSLRSVTKLPLTKNPALRRSLDRIMKSYKTPSPQLINPNINDFTPTFVFNVVVISSNPCSLFRTSDTREFPEEAFNDQLIQIEGKESDYFPSNNIYYLNNEIVRGGNNYYVDINNRDWVIISNEGIKLEEGTCTFRDIRNSGDTGNPPPSPGGGDEPGRGGEESGGGGEEIIPRDTGGIIPGGEGSGGGNNPNPPGDGGGRDDNSSEPIIDNRFRV